MPRLHAVALAMMAAPILLGGCAGETNLARDLAIASGVTGGEPKPPPDFVTRTRTGRLDYVPVGTSAPPRSKPKTAAEVGSAEKELDALRSRTDARGEEARRAGAAQ